MIVDSLVDIVVGTTILVGLLEQLENEERISTEELKEAIADAQRLREWISTIDPSVAQKMKDMLDKHEDSVVRKSELAISEIIRQHVSSVDIAFSRIMKEIEKESV